MAPTVFDASGIVDLAEKPPVLWIRGDADQIVSDTSLFDLAFLGSVGAVPGWPGPRPFPPQPMVTQTRAVLDRYAATGGGSRGRRWGPSPGWWGPGPAVRAGPTGRSCCPVWAPHRTSSDRRSSPSRC